MLAYMIKIVIAPILVAFFALLGALANVAVVAPMRPCERGRLCTWEVN